MRARYGASDFDLLVIGAGVIGLGVAAEAASRGMRVLIAERHPHFGTETSSRNSEVIHAGLYYPPGSLKAAACVSGRDRLYEFCTQHGVPFRRCGKLIVASSASQLDKLRALDGNARACGVSDLEYLDARAARRLEPDLAVVGALLSPSSGIIDSHALMLALLGTAEANGAQLVTHTTIDRTMRRANGWEVFVDGEREPVLTAGAIVNAAGLSAGIVAAKLDGYPASLVRTVRFAKGTYFSYSGPTPFRRLIYPMPEPGGLGIHLTLDLAGAARFGPDVEWVDELDYDVLPTKREVFAERIRSYWPGVETERLQPAYAGIRPKLTRPHEATSDFDIEGPETHGLPGLVNLYGIESPGLTSVLSLADLALDRLFEAGFAEPALSARRRNGLAAP